MIIPAVVILVLLIWMVFALSPNNNTTPVTQSPNSTQNTAPAPRARYNSTKFYRRMAACLF